MKFITSRLSEAHIEGAGSQYQRYVFAYLYALDLEVEYLHLPNKHFKGHDPEGLNIDIGGLWGRIFLFLLNKDLEVLASNYLNGEMQDDPGVCVSNVSFKSAYSHIAGLNKNRINKLIQELRIKFWEFNKNQRPNFEGDEIFIIAIHLRAISLGDKLTSIDSLPWQYFNYDYGLPDNNPEYYSRLYASAVDSVAKRVDKKIVLHVHSTGNPSDFEDFLSRIDPSISVKLFLDEIAPVAFMDMLCSDVLIGSHSSFSWLAILLRNKPSYIRKGFRHFLPENAFELREVYFDDESFLGSLPKKMSLLFSYLKFYPKYFYKLIVTRAYF